MSGHSNCSIYGLAIDATQRFAFTGADDHIIKVWDLSTGCLLYPFSTSLRDRQTIRGHRGKITDMAINANNTILMSASEDGIIFFWDIAPLTTARQVCYPCYHYLSCCKGHRSYICQLRYDENNDLLFSVGDDGFIRAWNVSLLETPFGRQRACTENDLIAFSLYHGPTQPTPFSRADKTASLYSVLFCDLTADGRFLASGCLDGSVHVWRIPKIERNCDMRLTHQVRLFPPSHSQYSTAEAVSLRVQTLREHTKGVDTVVFSHAGDAILTASEVEGNACVWSCSPDFAVCKPMVLHCDISPGFWNSVNRRLFEESQQGESEQLSVVAERRHGDHIVVAEAYGEGSGVVRGGCETVGSHNGCGVGRVESHGEAGDHRSRERRERE